jgi:DNA-binding GntR family transcriptional regulator
MFALMALIRGPSASDRAYFWTRERILDGTFPTGKMITEGEISDSVGVSRTPVREAFLRLSSEGILELFPKRGAFVVPVTSAEMRNVIEARLLIEGWAAGVVAASPDRAGTVRLLGECIDEMNAARADEPLRYAEADRRFHETLVAATDNTHLAEFYRSLRDRQLRISIALRSMRVRTERVHTEHQNIMQAIAGGDEVRAADLVRDHIGKNRDALELKLRVG